MVNRSGALGAMGEKGLVDYLKSTAWPHAERRKTNGQFDRGDVAGTPGICWESKAGNAAETATDAKVAAWLVETERERRYAGADVGILVMKRTGVGPAKAGRWWAVLPMWQLADLLKFEVTDDTDNLPVRMTLADIVVILRAAGYGNPLPKFGAA